MASTRITSSIFTNDILVSKYKGCLIGCLAGDCLGAAFEGHYNPKISRVIKQIDPQEYKTSRKFKYTDDTALTKAIAQSLVEKNGFFVDEMARSLYLNFSKEPWRGYASGAASLFNHLKFIDKNGQLKENCFEPAKSLFNGTGSYGNGSGMRAAPLGLYTAHLSIEEMIVLGTLATKLTHYHRFAVIGGLIQCFAVRLAIKSDQHDVQSHQFFIDFFKKIIDFTELIEKKSVDEVAKEIGEEKINKICNNGKFYLDASRDKSFISDSHYSNTLKKLFKYIETPNIIDFNEIHQVCDCSVNAIESIPIALFSFLIASNPKFEKEVDDKLDITDSFKRFKIIERVVFYSIAFGGDTDTIASMAASIAGALFGLNEQTMENQTFNKLEDSENVIRTAEKLYNLVSSLNSVQT